ncbi:hypothetical protein [Agarilytica rhodophyticola]|uniref:hypothetical protein n=1 Tax=Agarilytica rhodophyticola TaxID=1737490 RepID=UPI000B344B3E|nr:hypothetical protein [Agarilytica rhodophyticola]
MIITSHITLCTGEPKNIHYVRPGERVELPDEEAEYLIQQRIAKSHALNDSDLASLTSTLTQTLTAPTLTQTLTAPTLSQVDRIDAIIDAMAELEEGDFGKDGKPSVRAIEKILEQNISALERDRAWELYQQLLHDNAQDQENNSAIDN